MKKYRIHLGFFLLWLVLHGTLTAQNFQSDSLREARKFKLVLSNEVFVLYPYHFLNADYEPRLNGGIGAGFSINTDRIGLRFSAYYSTKNYYSDQPGIVYTEPLLFKVEYLNLRTGISVPLMDRRYEKMNDLIAGASLLYHIPLNYEVRTASENPSYPYPSPHKATLGVGAGLSCEVFLRYQRRLTRKLDFYTGIFSQWKTINDYEYEVQLSHPTYNPVFSSDRWMIGIDAGFELFYNRKININKH